MSPRQILLGKLWSKLWPGVQLILSGIPVLALMQLFGGISGEMLILMFVVHLTLLFCAGCGSITAAIVTTSNSDIKVYLGSIAFQVGAQIIGSISSFAFLKLIGRSSIWLWILISLFACFFAWIWLLEAVRTFKELENESEKMSRRKRGLHSGVNIVKPGNSIRADRERVTAFEATDFAILWKEAHFPVPGKSAFVGVYLLILFLILVSWVLLPALQVVRNESPNWMIVQGLVANPLICWSLVWMCAVCMHLTDTISKERRYQRIHELLLIPMERIELLRSKWWGSFGRYRWMFRVSIALIIFAILFLHIGALLFALMFLVQFLALSWFCLYLSCVSGGGMRARWVWVVLFLVMIFVCPEVMPQLRDYVVEDPAKKMVTTTGMWQKQYEAYLKQLYPNNAPHVILSFLTNPLGSDWALIEPENRLMRGMFGKYAVRGPGNFLIGYGLSLLIWFALFLFFYFLSCRAFENETGFVGVPASVVADT